MSAIGDLDLCLFGHVLEQSPQPLLANSRYQKLGKPLKSAVQVDSPEMSFAKSKSTLAFTYQP
jgi:hypothetical protein